jgi:hypothetical protein
MSNLHKGISRITQMYSQLNSVQNIKAIPTHSKLLYQGSGKEKNKLLRFI